jgi:dihydroxy-acid dehydratase
MNQTGSRMPRASRELIADCMELVIRRHHFDALVAIAGGDKTIPGVMMAMARLNLPSVFVYGGGTPEYACAPPTVGICERQFAAETLAMVAETLGLSPLSAVGTPAFSERTGQARQAGEIVLRILDEGGPLPRDLITRKSLDNACAAVAATGSSTNATLQLPAIAHEAGVPFTVHDLAPVFNRTLLMAGVQPGGRELAGNLYRSAGVPAVLRSLLAGGALHGDTLTIEAIQLQAALSNAGPVEQDSRQTLAS